MKICDNRKKQEWPEVVGPPMPGRVYQNVETGYFYVGTEGKYLICLEWGSSYSVNAGFCAMYHKFRDVTDYVCLDTSRLPPLEDDA